MEQSHSLIFWAKPKRESFDEAAERAYELMEVLMEYGETFYPKYQLNEKYDKQPFQWELSTFKKALRQGINREGEIEFLDLGYSINFISSWEQQDRVSIQMTVGIQKPIFNNTFIIGLPSGLSLGSEPDKERVESVFKRCIEVFRPEWAAVVNDWNKRRKDQGSRNLSKRMHWMNYWSSERVQEIGEKRVREAPIFNVEQLHEGCLLKLQENPIDDERIEDLERQLAAKKYFEG
ncbi:hypothetical protein QWJ34_15605 [Saccharibacillus sp. CPCC 101409]|uniref:hypothetical protein n=1 Tax=Saccharibacillus sp. CPCC 101409 TaxID=3058041 RepID=UPI00267245D4|nr:hypothetical protein [Saccharibacillus sp. CPCC 101409]MDO3411191.1 hypothetical protein [Saccharibacillus sp. CPCC 101409]